MDAERREARRRKILDQSGSRMDRILQTGGVSKEPALDGYKPSKVFDESQSNGSFENNNYTGIGENLSYDAADKGLKLTKLRFYECPRLCTAFALGAIMRLIFAFGMDIMPQNIAVPFIVHELIYELHDYWKVRHLSAQRWPRHGYVVDFFIFSFGFPEPVTYGIGVAMDVGFRLMNDAVLMLSSFIVTHTMCEYFAK